MRSLKPWEELFFWAVVLSAAGTLLMLLICQPTTPPEPWGRFRDEVVHEWPL
jgi:hypothetical protein